MIKKINAIALLILFFMMLIYGNLNYEMSMQALKIWFEKLVPSMFVVMVLVKLMFSLSILSWATKPFSPLFSHCFHMSKQSVSYLFAIMFLGFPSSAAFLNDQVKQGNLLIQDAKRLILTCSFATPGFVIMTCGTVLYHSSTLGIWLFLIQIISGLILLFFTRSKTITSIQTSKTTISLMDALKTSMIDSGMTLFMIGGYLMLCMSIAALLTQFLPTNLQMVLRTVIEFSSGSILISTFPFSIQAQLILLSSLLSFGGFCVHLQVMCMSNECKLSYPTYLRYRILQAVISALLTYLLLPLFL